MKYRIVQLINRRAHLDFVQSSKDPQKRYKDLENEILNCISHSVFWKSQSIKISQISDFPISDYEIYRPTLERSFLEAAENPISPLNGEPIRFWCLSSGTSSEPKKFPITSSFSKQMLRISGALSYNIASHLKSDLKYPIVFFPATNSGNKTLSGVEVGFISRYMFLNQPALVRKSYGLPEFIFEDDKLLSEWGPIYGAATEVSCLLATVPSLLTNYCESIQNRKDEIFAYLSGSKKWPSSLPQPNLSKQRLAQIEKAFTNSNLQMQELWPHLKLIVSWKGATAGLQVPRLQKFNLKNIPFADAVYSATEGWMTVPLLQGPEAGTPLHPGSTYVEFFPEDEEIEPARLLKPWELEVGKNYEVILSQAMGFIRYRLKDVVRCNGFFNQTPILEFLYKAGNMVSLGHTRFSEVQILEALRLTGFNHPFEWTIGPAADGAGMIFYSTHVNTALISAVQKFDQKLSDLNPEIADDYKQGLLRPMQVQRLSMEHEFWKAGRHGQGKLRVLVQVALS